MTNQQTMEPRALMTLIGVSDYAYPQGWVNSVEIKARSQWYCSQLEAGKILIFNDIPFELSTEERNLLTSQQRDESSIHKNISYRPASDMLRGGPNRRSPAGVQLGHVMRKYSASVTRFLSDFLGPYSDSWSLDFASYRPLEEKGRNLSLHKRNDLLHIDAFPSRPTKGGRILRVFTNLNPSESRFWITTDGFQILAKSFAIDAGLEQISSNAGSFKSTVQKGFASLLRTAGIPLPERSAYDQFMLKFHDYLKENADFQSRTEKIQLEFPPLSTWIVFTDAVPHAVLSGRFALEHTYIVPVSGLLSPENSPISVLENMCQRKLSA